MSGASRELALFNLAIDSKLRACDLVRLRVEDLWSGSSIRDRATIIQKKTKRAVQFEVTEQTKTSLASWLPFIRRNNTGYLFPSRRKTSQHLSTRQYARIVHRWVESIGLESSSYGTHSMRRTKTAQIYKKTGNLRAVQILLGHTTRKYCAISRRRGRRCSAHRRTDRPMTNWPPEEAIAVAPITTITVMLDDYRPLPSLTEFPRLRPNGGTRSM
jgi:integrase